MSHLGYADEHICGVPARVCTVHGRRIILGLNKAPYLGVPKQTGV